MKLKLFLIFLLALSLRWLFLPKAAITFGYDQARDAYIAGEIINGDLKILGPSVSGVPGLYHGVLYYYLIAPAYLFGHGNPVYAAYLMSFLNALGVFITYGLVYILTNKKDPALISALIFAFSFEATQYANWLSNPSMAVWFVPLIYIGLYLWITKKQKWGAVLTGLGLGMSVQSNVSLAYHLAPVFLWLFICKKRIKIKEVICFFITLFIAVSPMLLVEIKFGLKGIRGLFYLFTSHDVTTSQKALGDFFVIYLNQLGKIFAYTLFPLNLVFGGLIGLAILILVLNKWIKGRDLLSWEPFLSSYILAHIIALPFGGSSTPHITAGMVVGVSAFIGIFLWESFRNKTKILIYILSFIFIANSVKIVQENLHGQTNFAIQKDLILSKELEVVDYTYFDANGKSFSFNNLTSPLFVNTLWSYLYNWYGKGKYGYVPSYTGRDQIGQPGDNLVRGTGDTNVHFYIIEPLDGIPRQYLGLGNGEENTTSDLVVQKEFGNILVQKRILRR